MNGSEEIVDKGLGTVLKEVLKVLNAVGSEYRLRVVGLDQGKDIVGHDIAIDLDALEALHDPLLEQLRLVVVEFHGCGGMAREREISR